MVEDKLIRELSDFIPRCAQEERDKQTILWYARQFPDNILTRQNPVAHMTSSGLVLNEGLDKVLMVHHNIYQTWAWTGGHADGEWNLLAVALKEAREETGAVHVRPLMEEMASISSGAWAIMGLAPTARARLAQSLAVTMLLTQRIRGRRRRTSSSWV